MAGDKRELILDLLARDKSGPATKSFAKNLKDSGDAADKASKSTDKFSTSSDKAGSEATKLANSAEGASRSIGKLDGEIRKAEAELDRLARSFAETDDAAARLDVSKSIRKVENEIRRLTKSKNLIKVPVEPDARGFMAKLGAGIGSAGGSIATSAGSAVGPVVGGAIAAAAAPVLISALGSAVSAGAGAGFLGAGIMLAVKKDPNIQAAGKALGQKFMGEVNKSATKNFAGPIRQSLGILDDAAERSAKKIGKTFDALGGSVVPLTRDVVSSAERMLTAFTNVASKSGPALDGLGGSVRLLADGVGDFIETIADGSDDAAANLQMIAGATADVLRYSGLVLKTFSDLANNAWVTGPLLPLLRKHYQNAADESDDMAGSQTELANQMTNAQKAAEGQRNALDELSKELREQNDPVFALLNAQDELEQKQKAVGEATKEHGAKSKETRRALRDLAESALDLQGKAGALGDTFNGELTPELKATLRAAGLTDNQIGALGKEFQRAKKDGDRFARNYKASVSVANAAGARKSLYSVRDAANSIPRAVTIAMRITGQTNVSKVAAGIRKQYEARATGGPITKDTPYWVGENGPELVFPNHNGRVLSAAASRASARHVGPQSAAMGSGGGGGVYRLELAGEAQVVAFIRSLIRRHNLLQVGA